MSVRLSDWLANGWILVYEPNAMEIADLLAKTQPKQPLIALVVTIVDKCGNGHIRRSSSKA